MGGGLLDAEVDWQKEMSVFEAAKKNTTSDTITRCTLGDRNIDIVIPRNCLRDCFDLVDVVSFLAGRLTRKGGWGLLRPVLIKFWSRVESIWRWTRCGKPCQTDSHANQTVSHRAVLRQIRIHHQVLTLKLGYAILHHSRIA